MANWSEWKDMGVDLSNVPTIEKSTSSSVYNVVFDVNASISNYKDLTVNNFFIKKVVAERGSYSNAQSNPAYNCYVKEYDATTGKLTVWSQLYCSNTNEGKNIVTVAVVGGVAI